MRKTIFISDLHLDENQPGITQLALQFLNRLDTDVDAVYILGDLFEAWIGDDNITPFYSKIMDAFEAVTEKNIPLYFIHGNRDFLIGKKFSLQTGCVLLPEETKINLYGTPVLIMHGDTLCTKDQTYMRARKKMHNRFLQSIFLLLPLSLRKKIANKIRNSSREHTSSVSEEIMDVTQDEVERIMQKHDVSCLIHGHTHRPGFHEFLLRHTPAERIVLGAWHHYGNMLVWDETGKKELIEFAIDA
jgi:UDP-2,3-diacylglucosamine hydrolase